MWASEKQQIVANDFVFQFANIHSHDLDSKSVK